MSSKSEVFEFSGGKIHLRCPFSNSDELFQSKDLCKNLVWIGWAFQELAFEFSGGGGGQKSPISGVTCDLRYPFSNLAELFQSKVMCENLVWIGWAFQELSCPQTFFSVGGETPIRGCYIWPVMPIFELGCAIPVKSHMLKFGLDWLKSEVC